MDKDVIAKEVKNLDAKKAVTQDDIPVKILKLNNDIFCQYLSQIFNESIETVSFPNDFKCADITLVYKKKDSKRRIIDLSALFVIPKSFERCFSIKSIKTLTRNCLDIKWAIEKETALNIY